MLLELRLELLLLLLEQVKTSKAKAHHICGHHVGQHVREAERRHLVVMSTRRSTELLKALKLSLRLSKIGSKGAVSLNRADTTI